MAWKARAPDMKLRVKVEKLTNTVGAAWVNDDGSVSIQLYPGTVIDWRLTQEGYLTLFPREDKVKDGEKT